MMRSLYSAISGLRNHQTRMDVIGNNIANVNTTGFKQSRVTFEDALSQTMQGASGPSGNNGGTNPMQVGLGMATASIDTIFTDGSFSPTGKSTDLGISGNGFFVLSDGQNKLYTRNGAFDFDTGGNFVLPGSGYKVVGWKADANGNLDTTQPTTNIQIPVGATMPAKASTKITYGGNLLADAAIRGSLTDTTNALTTIVTNANDLVTAANAAVTNAAVPQPPNNAWIAAATAAQTAATTAQTDAAAAQSAMANYIAGTGTPDAAIAAINKAVTSAANAVTAAQTLATTAAADPATISFTQNATTLNNNAASAVPLVKAATITTSQTTASIQVYDSQGNAYKVNGTFTKTAANTWSFTPAATITNDNGVLIGNVSGGTATVTFNADGTYNTATTAPLTITPPAGSPYAGAGATKVSLDFSTMTQYGGGGSSTATSNVTVDRDGYTSGTLESKTVSKTGVITGRFSNGQSQDLAQVALASFNNPAGLEKMGESLYVKSNNSGEPQVGTAGTGGRGSFSPGTLEMSNVDLATEFSNMIVTQRGFQANSKVITTTDSMLEELVNLKR